MLIAFTAEITNNRIALELSQHAGKEAHGMIFIKDVSDAYEIGTKQRGEAVPAAVFVAPKASVLFPHLTLY
jgi:hypothetical protein